MKRTQFANIPFSKAAEVRRFRQARGRPLQTLAPVHPNVGMEMEYRRALYKTIEAMNTSVIHFLSAAYKQNEPAIAQDELPADALKRVIRRLTRRWTTNFDKASEELAAYFSQSISQRSDKQLEAILRKGGFSVKFRKTRAMNDVMKAAINENVSLIKTIPARYFSAIEGAVMRSVATGRDLAPLTAFLEREYGVTRRRAALIARDQNNKTTATMTRVRQVELGITEAIWVHSAGGREPRPTHVAAGARQQRYDVTKGWLDPAVGKYIFPGELINCRCVSKSVIPGFS